MSDANVILFQEYLGDGGFNANGAEPDDPFRKFLENAQLAGELGRNGWHHVARLAEETQDIDARASQIMLKAHAATDAMDEEIVPTSTRLAKSDHHEWIHSRMKRFGKSADEIVSDWCAEFPNRRPEIESELRSVAARIDAA